MTATTIYQLSIPAICSILLAVNIILAPRNPYTQKNNPFECGFLSFLWQNRVQFSISFFLFALLFLLFDLEVLLVYPYFLSSYTNDIYGLVIMVMFLILLIIGFGFELSKKALKIDSRQTKLVFIDLDQYYKDSYVNLVHSSLCDNICKLYNYLRYNVCKLYNYIRYSMSILYINLRYTLYIYIRYTLYSKLRDCALMYGPKSMLASVVCGSNAWRYSELIINDYTNYENWLRSITTTSLFVAMLIIASLLYINWEIIFLSFVSWIYNITEIFINIKHALRRIMLKTPACIMIFIKALLRLTYYLAIVIFINITLSICPMIVCTLADLLNLNNISTIINEITRPTILYCEGGSAEARLGSSSSSSGSTSGESPPQVQTQAQPGTTANTSEPVENKGSEELPKKRKATETIQDTNKTRRIRVETSEPGSSSASAPTRGPMRAPTPAPEIEQRDPSAKAIREEHFDPAWEQGCYAPELGTRDAKDAHVDFWTQLDFVDEWQSMSATKEADGKKIYAHILAVRKAKYGTKDWDNLTREQQEEDYGLARSITDHIKQYHRNWEVKVKKDHQLGVDTRVYHKVNRNLKWKNVR